MFHEVQSDYYEAGQKSFTKCDKCYKGRQEVIAKCDIYYKV